jgi:NADH-quinone oxidoreductase subunit C
MNERAITEKVQVRFGAKVLSTYEFREQCAVTVKPADVREVLCFLRDDPELQFGWLMDVGGVDYLGFPDDGPMGDDQREHRFEVVYQLYSMERNHRYRVKVAVREDSPEVPSVWDLWGTANWMEREVYDMFGVRFPGHPNLRRILCHDQFEGHALRKDYPIQRRQKLTEPTETLMCDKPEWA